MSASHRSHVFIARLLSSPSCANPRFSTHFHRPSSAALHRSTNLLCAAYPHLDAPLFAHRAYIRPAEFLPHVFEPSKYKQDVLNDDTTASEHSDAVEGGVSQGDLIYSTIRGHRGDDHDEEQDIELPKRRGTTGEVMWSIEREVKECIRALDPLTMVEKGRGEWTSNRVRVRQLIREFAEMEDLDVRAWLNRGRKLTIAMLQACGKYNLPKEGIRLWERIGDLKWKKDIDMVNAFVTMLARTKRHPSAPVDGVEADILKQINEIALKPNEVTFGAFYLLCGCRLSQSLIKKQRKMGIRWKKDPNAVDHVLRVLCEMGGFAKAWEIFREVSVREDALEVPDSTWRAMISSCVHLPDVDDPEDRANIALATLRLMEDVGLTPSVDTLHAVARVLRLVGETQLLLDFHHEMERHHDVRTAESVALVLQACADEYIGASGAHHRPGTAKPHGDRRKHIASEAEQVYSRAQSVPGLVDDRIRSLMRTIRKRSSDDGDDVGLRTIKRTVVNGFDYLAPLGRDLSNDQQRNAARKTPVSGGGRRSPPWKAILRGE